MCEEIPSSSPSVKSNSSQVRLQERWSYWYKHNWRYDFTKVAQGKHKEAASKHQPSFEIELELLPSAFKDTRLSDKDLAVHFTEKLLDLLGRYDSKLQKEKVPLYIKSKWQLYPNTVNGVR